jgi:outer membrane protein assembly factor BamB
MRRTQRPAFRATVGGAVGAFAALLCVLAGPAATATAATTTTWRTDGYGPGNTGYNPVETAVNAGTVDDLTRRWGITAPEIEFACARQWPPVVAGNRLFLSDPRGVSAYDAGTGRRLWSYAFADPTDAQTPALTVVGERLFVAVSGCQSVSDPDGDLIALNVRTGAVLWAVSRDAPVRHLLVDKDVALIAGVDTGEARVTAYRVSDGGELWTRRAELGDEVSANGRVLINPIDDDDNRTGSELVDIRTGAALWATPQTFEVLAAGPAGGPLYAAGPGGTLVRINVETGAVVWSVPGAPELVSTDGPRLYVVEGTDLVARDSGTGAQLWRRAYGARLGKPVVAGGVLYATTFGVGVAALAPTTGAPLPGAPAFDGAIGHPVVVNGRLYVTTGRVLGAFTP